MTYRQFYKQLQKIYDLHEAQSIARLVFHHQLGLTFEEICVGADENLTLSDALRLDNSLQRLLNDEPVQYVLGLETFFDREFYVNKDVLIPRPETEDLCQWAIDILRDFGEKHCVLDVGTGSGCIAITIANEVEGAQVEAMDISEQALAVARHNANRYGQEVKFLKQNILEPFFHVSRCYDMIISNPPYVCEKERREMDNNVLRNEPFAALFVPNDDPLMFYKAIVDYSLLSLNRGGWLLFEVNPVYADDVMLLMREKSFAELEIRNDRFGKKRMVGGRLR